MDAMEAAEIGAQAADGVADSASAVAVAAMAAGPAQTVDAGQEPATHAAAPVAAMNSSLEQPAVNQDAAGDQSRLVGALPLRLCIEHPHAFWLT